MTGVEGVGAIGAVGLWRFKNKHKIPNGIKSMCVAYSRPKNLGNIFTYRKIDRLDGPPGLLLFGVETGDPSFLFFNQY